MMTTTEYAPDATSPQWTMQDALSAYGRLVFAIETEVTEHTYLARVRTAVNSWTDQYRSTVDGCANTPGITDAMADTAYQRAFSRWSGFTKSR